MFRKFTTRSVAILAAGAVLGLVVAPNAFAGRVIYYPDSWSWSNGAEVQGTLRFDSVNSWIYNGNLYDRKVDGDGVCAVLEAESADGTFYKDTSQCVWAGSGHSTGIGMTSTTAQVACVYLNVSIVNGKTNDWVDDREYYWKNPNYTGSHSCER